MSTTELSNVLVSPLVECRPDDCHTEVDAALWRRTDVIMASIRRQMPTGISILWFEGLRYHVRAIVVRPSLTITIELLKALSLVKQHKHCLHFSSSTPKTSIHGTFLIYLANCIPILEIPKHDIAEILSDILFSWQSPARPPRHPRSSLKFYLENNSIKLLK